LGTRLKNDPEDISLRVKSGWWANYGKDNGLMEKMSHDLEHDTLDCG